jgi:hypothetical protein
MVVHFLAYVTRSLTAVFEKRQCIALSQLHPGQTKLPYLMHTHTGTGLYPILSIIFPITILHWGPQWHSG